MIWEVQRMRIKMNDNERLIIESGTGNELEVWADNMGIGSPQE